MSERAYVLSIAGFDPSQGAGIGADLKTFEQHQVYGLGVCSAITYQDDSSFEGVDWIAPEKILHQFKLMAERFPFVYAKIGLIQSVEVLDWLLPRMLELRPELRIVWDPILKASAGFDFHSSFDWSGAKNWLAAPYLITPNAGEALNMAKTHDIEEAGKTLSSFTNVWIKSAVPDEHEIIDHLYVNGERKPIGRPRLDAAKHGSGCVLSASATAYLAKGFELPTACGLARSYMHYYLQSSDNLLGEHHNIATTRGYK